MLNQSKNLLTKIAKTLKLFDDLKEIETFTFLIDKDKPRYIDMLDTGDNKLMRFLQSKVLFYNDPYNICINFAKLFLIAVYIQFISINLNIIIPYINIYLEVN